MPRFVITSVSIVSMWGLVDARRCNVGGARVCAALTQRLRLWSPVLGTGTPVPLAQPMRRQGQQLA